LQPWPQANLAEAAILFDMALFTRRTNAMKLEVELSALTARAGLLTGKRTAAQGMLDATLEARQTLLLTGDVEDTKATQACQAKIDTATSALAGFDAAIAALVDSIAVVETKIAAQQNAADRKDASEQLAAQTDLLENQLGPWLALTRDLAASAALVGGVHFEASQIGGYLRNAASEIETAVHVSVNNLRGTVAAILASHHPIPRKEGTVQTAATIFEESSR
jgi:hypothetical protein